MKTRRLQTLDRFLQLPGDSAPVEDNLRALAELVGAEVVASGGGRILKIVDDIDLFPYSEIKDIASHLDGTLYRRWHLVTGGDDLALDPRRFLFFDIETTGLSGGVGTVAFLVGFGFFEGSVFRVVQYFLPDYPNEPLLLELVSGEIGSGRVLISYNGRAFDWPILTQRWIINRRAVPQPADHLDVLHPARALFRKLGEDCSLISLEKNLLAFERGEDIPGYLIPSKYFDYLYDRQPGMIPEIIRHNRLDVISLALVTRHIPEFLSRPEKVTRVELLDGVVRHFYRNRRLSALIAYLEQVGPGYLEESSLVTRLMYSLALKSEKHWEKASLIWRQAAETGSGPDLFRHLLELAKYQEHREKDVESALETVDLMLEFDLPPRQKAALLHRRKRLGSKQRRLS